MEDVKTTDSKKLKWHKFKEKFILVAISIMAIGQWADTKALLEDLYVDIVSNFTHHYEYQQLSTINVGSNLVYISERFGAPQLIKQSKYQEDVNFAYFLHEKYILTLILNDSRISAYSITALLPDFVPYGLLDKSPQEDYSKVTELAGNIVDYSIDYNNVNFVLVRESLGKDKLFINQYFGTIAYEQDPSLPAKNLKEISDSLSLDDSDGNVSSAVETLISNANNNYYGVGEVDLSLVTDSILTTFEYSLYAKKKT
jgi:hypothetical protein